MTISKRWIQRSVLCGLLLGGSVGCSMVSSPPVSQIAQNDHDALATWYDNEAAQLRQKAKSMEDMKVAYQNNPGLEHTTMGGSHKAGFIKHCDTLAALYMDGAKEADALAQGHRDMLKK